MMKMLVAVTCMLACTSGVARADVHEFAVFKFKAGTTRAEQVEAMRTLDAVVSRYEGFKQREYFYSEADDRWVDHVVWATMTQARASERALDDPAAATFVARIDPASVVFSRYERIEPRR